MKARRNRRPIQLRESAPTAVLEAPDAATRPVVLWEAGGAGSVAKGQPGRMKVRLIQAGWNSSGSRYYPAEVLERDGPKVFRSGTLNMIDHATEMQDAERPEGSLRDLASVQTSDAYWDVSSRSLMAEVRLFQPWREAITDMAGAIGMSIRAEGLGEYGEAEGRQGLIISSLTRGHSVDYVTRPGAGGGIVEVLESARVPLREARTLGAWLEARLHTTLTVLADEMYGDGRLTRPERITLSSAIGDGLSAWTARVEADAPQLFARDLYDEPVTDVSVAEATSSETNRALDAALTAAYVKKAGDYVWVCDHDPDRLLVWYQGRSSADGEHTWQQSYELGGDSGDVLVLVGAPVMVVARTEYEAVGPAGETEVENAASSDDAEPDEAPVAESDPTAQAGATTDVQDGTPPTLPAPPTEGSTSVSDTAVTTGPAPGSTAGATTATEAAVDTQPNVDSVRLAEAHRVALAEANARADKAIAEAATMRADATARDAVTRLVAVSQLEESLRPIVTPEITNQIVGHVPVLESGEVNMPALETAINEAIERQRLLAARMAEALGAGRVTGLGQTATTTAESDTSVELSKLFESMGMDPASAAIAGKGR